MLSTCEMKPLILIILHNPKIDVLDKDYFQREGDMTILRNVPSVFRKQARDRSIILKLCLFGLVDHTLITTINITSALYTT